MKETDVLVGVPTIEEALAMIGPEAKEKRRDYQREYRQRAAVKEKQRDYQREYRQRAAVKEKQREYQRKYYHNKKRSGGDTQ